MNVEGADVERRLGRTIMPRFHAGLQLRHGRRRRASGALRGRWLEVPLLAHLVGVAS